jgi:hypothetical protein
MFLCNSFVRMTIEGCGESNAVLETLAQHINRAADDIKASFLFSQLFSIAFWLFLFQFTFSL